MEKRVIVLLLLGILLVSPLVLAQEQAQTYSGFDRFIDNVKMVFSFGDNKVMLALKIREKEINSAIVNTENGDDKEANKNLERAWKKLQFVQESVTIDTAGEVTESAKEIMNWVIDQGNLTEDFDVYVLEEEKTGLTAEWVIEASGKEGQESTNWIVNGTVGGNRVWEIETRIGEIDGEISNWVVENSVGKDGEGDNGLTWEVKNEIAQGDEGLKPEVKTYVAGDGTLLDEPLPEPDLSETHYDPSQEEATTNQIEDTVVSGTVEEGLIDDVSLDDEDSTPEPSVVDDTGVSGGTPSDDVGGEDEGSGEPGVVDED